MIELTNIIKTYSSGETEVRAVNGVTLLIASGEFVAIMGASGSGKSTLMHILGLLDRPSEGSYRLAGCDITHLSDDERAALRNRTIGFVFQQFHLLARKTALDNAALPLVYAGIHASKQKAVEELTAVGLQHRLHHRPNQLSGGQQQRVAIARALVNDPLIIMADEPTGNLDTKSKGEIIDILKDLNRRGKTIVMVTHEPDMAAHAGRVIVMRDGVVISDERHKKVEAVNNDDAYQIVKQLRHAAVRTFDQDKFKDSFRQALEAMLGNKLRSFLSILGILIGVTAVIAMLALGTGAQDSIQKQLSSLGSNLLMVRPGQMRVQGVALESGSVTRLTFQDMQAIARIASVRRVSASVSGRVQAVYGSSNTNTQIEGVNPEYAPMRASIPVVGRFFTEEEVRSREKVAVLGATVVTNLFGDKDPIGETIKINMNNFKVIGIAPPKGGSSWRDQDDIILLPVTTAMYRLLGKTYIDTIYVEGVSADLLDETQEEVKQTLLTRYRIKNASEGDEAVDVRNMADLKAALETTTKTMSMLLGSIAAISLLVGGIGIMNIMLVSVTERTREIGLRKSIGATRTDILMQFMVESVLMATIGGVAGILLGSGISLLITLVAGWTVKIAISSVLLATGFSLIVGMVFGIWPANKAARLNPIDALRYD
ncbi:MAG: ABC transporter permease [Candidatus Omnitrophica bacterium]|nr:ABC transporter permease [Candidatus Omnitrophota bacterium]